MNDKVQYYATPVKVRWLVPEPRKTDLRERLDLVDLFSRVGRFEEKRRYF
jgi:hypothetical protein